MLVRRVRCGYLAMHVMLRPWSHSSWGLGLRSSMLGRRDRRGIVGTRRERKGAGKRIETLAVPKLHRLGQLLIECG